MSEYSFRYGALSAAAAEPDGLAVLGIFFKVQEKDNPVIGPLMDAISIVKTPGTSKTLAEVMPLKVNNNNKQTDEGNGKRQGP